jgi:hypothetical protein
VSLARGLVEALVAAAPAFAPRRRGEKVRLLDRLASLPIRDPRLLHRLHEALCFLQAYPDDAEVLVRAEEALRRFPERVRRLRGAARRRLHDSGIAGTRLDYPFGLPMARWLASRFPHRAEVMWGKLRETDPLQEALPLLVQRAEEDAASDEGGLGWRRWLQAAKGARRLTDLEVLLELFDGAPLEPEQRDWLFESLGLPIGWRLGDRGASRTLPGLPWPRPFYHGQALPVRLDGAAFLRAVRRPLPSLRRAPRGLAGALIEAARLAMATRLRELFAFSYANPDDVLVADPGRGLRIALIGILPRFRLPYHGYYAYLALKNGVPVGYGGGWQLFGVLEVGVNMFESFRRGESAFVVSQVMRAYHQALGMREIVVDPYQIGQDNPEALRSGAFYFYHRLGFRPRDPGVRAVAEREEERIAREPGYRSPLPVMKALARSEVYLPLSPGSREERPPLRASALAALVTADIARRFDGDRARAAREATRRVARALGARGWTRWSRDERRGFERLAPLLALLPDLARWPVAERRRLVLVLRAKGGSSEAAYTRLLDRHRRLRRSLEALAAAPLPAPARHLGARPLGAESS